jgi:hypothetical protein
MDCSLEGLKYVAGYLAHKLRVKYPELGSRTSEQYAFAQATAPWISTLSRGGLTVPSVQFMENILAFEELFKEIHGDGLNTQHKVMQTTIEYITLKFPSIPNEIIKKYVRTRTFIRIKFLNHQLKAEDEARKLRNLNKRKHFTK